MFGRRRSLPALPEQPVAPVAAGATVADLPVAVPAAAAQRSAQPQRSVMLAGRDGLREKDRDRYYRLKQEIFTAMVEAVDLAAIAALSNEDARSEIRDLANEIVSLRDVAVTFEEREELIKDLCDDVLGLGPLEELLAQDRINDIMVNGPNQIYVEVDGRMQRTNIRFRDSAQLLNVCQRIVGQVGRRVDDASPICDARLQDGSRVNVIVPPLALEGPVLTIRKFRKDRLTLDAMIDIGSLSEPLAELIKIIGRCRCNVLISGGTGSGKTTLLNCITASIDDTERIVTCEDTAELQLQQPHVVRLETRPPNLEGAGEVTMRDLVRNCLRMRPERIIVGEVRGPEALDLLQAMNTGHDGSMGTLHANSPREALYRLEALITLGSVQLSSKIIRDMISTSLDVVIQAERLRDGSRKVMSIAEVVGLEGDTIVLQELAVFDVAGEGADGRLMGQHRGAGIYRPKFWDRARYFGEDRRLARVMEDLNAVGEAETRIA